MEILELKIKECNKCGNLLKPKCDSFKKGGSQVLLIGESPAKDGWLVSGKAFYNTKNELQATGKVLSKLLSICNLTIDDISFTECCKCHVADRKQLERFSNNCKPFLLEQIKKLNVKIVLAMGLFPTQVLLDKKIKKFADVVGKEFIIDNKTIIPIYHCSPVNPKCYNGNVEIFKKINAKL